MDILPAQAVREDNVVTHIVIKFLSELMCFDNYMVRLIRDTSDKIETWEDLLEAGDKPSSNAQAPSQGAWRGGPTRTSLLHPGKVTVGGARIR